MLLAYEKGAALIVSRRLALQPRRVPRQAAQRDVLDLPHPAADRRDPRRRQGRQPPLQPGPRRSSSALFFGAFAFLLVIVVMTAPALAELVDLLWLKIKVLGSGSIDGVLAALSRGLAGGGLPRARGRHPDRRRPRRATSSPTPRRACATACESDIEDARAKPDELQRRPRHASEFSERAYPALVGRPPRRPADRRDRARRPAPVPLSDDIEEALDPTGAEPGEVSVVRTPPDVAALAE